jgi:hypothetical protein
VRARTPGDDGVQAPADEVCRRSIIERQYRRYDPCRDELVHGGTPPVSLS